MAKMLKFTVKYLVLQLPMLHGFLMVTFCEIFFKIYMVCLAFIMTGEVDDIYRAFLSREAFSDKVVNKV